MSRKIVSDAPYIPDTYSTYNAANRLVAVMGDIILPRGKGAACRKHDRGSRSGALAPFVYYSWDGDDELFFSETRMAMRPGNYMFDNIFHGYESGALLYKNLTAGTVENGNPDIESLIYEVKYYTYLNGLKVGFSEVQTPYAPSYFYVYDGQGNVVQISNRAGDLPYDLYKYSSYGEKVSIGGTGSQEHGTYKGYDEGPFGFKTGVRDYDPQTGRFMQPDPFKGYLSEPASQNPYMYCRGNPVKYSDPSGYSEFWPKWNKKVNQVGGSKVIATAKLLKVHYDERTSQTINAVLINNVSESFMEFRMTTSVTRQEVLDSGELSPDFHTALEKSVERKITLAPGQSGILRGIGTYGKNEQPVEGKEYNTFGRFYIEGSPKDGKPVNGYLEGTFEHNDLTPYKDY